MKALSVALLASLWGCTAPNPLSCADDFCHDPALPFCDKDGSIGGTPNTCVAVACTANEFAGCRGDEVLTCNSSGSDFNVAPCEFGCDEAVAGCNVCERGTPECERHLVPAHMPTACDTFAELPALDVAAATSLDTSDDATCTGGIIDYSTGADVCVVRHKTITVHSQASIKVTGARSIAFVADTELKIDGTIDVSADFITNGPGGGAEKSGLVGSHPSGSGGAGFKTAGAPGGADAGDAGNGGAARPNPALAVELVGGTQSSALGLPYSYVGRPGGGGGALALISCRGSLQVDGLIDAGGGGGETGSWFDAGPNGPGGAGGSGGYVVLQGMDVSVTGEIFANGGGGGAGFLSPWCEAAGIGGCGADGSRSATEAAHGGQQANGSGAGGSGGIAGAAPRSGTRRTTTLGNPTSGGGGGSAGFIQVLAPAGASLMLTPRSASPALEPTLTVQTR